MKDNREDAEAAISKSTTSRKLQLSALMTDSKIFTLRRFDPAKLTRLSVDLCYYQTNYQIHN